MNATYWPSAEPLRLCSTSSLGVRACTDDQVCANFLQYGVIEDLSTFSILNFGISTFDSFFDSLYTVFQIITMDGWTAITYSMMDSSIAFIAALFFSTLIFLGSFFLVNLILAVILESFIAI